MTCTSESAEISDDPVRDIRDLDESGVVGLGDERRVGDGQAADLDVDHVAADLDRGELDAEATVSLVHDLVRDVRPLLRTWSERERKERMHCAI